MESVSLSWRIHGIYRYSPGVWLLSLPLIPASGTTFECQKQVSKAMTSNYIPQFLWCVITCPCPWYLRVIRHSFRSRRAGLMRVLRDITASFSPVHIYQVLRYTYRGDFVLRIQIETSLAPSRSKDTCNTPCLLPGVEHYHYPYQSGRSPRAVALFLLQTLVAI